MAFFLTDDLNQQDKLEELGKIRDAINALGGKIEPLGDKPAEIAKEVSKIIKQFDILWVILIHTFNSFATTMTLESHET